MRELATEEKIIRFMQELGQRTSTSANVYFTGGVTAVLKQWRTSTIDIDLIMIPETDDIFRAIPRLKEELTINLEIAAPSHFIPELVGWKDRSIFIARYGKISFYHYDLYSQALAKIERNHTQDQADVENMISQGLIKTHTLLKCFKSIKPKLFRFPAIDPPSFQKRVEKLCTSSNQRSVRKL